MRRQSTIAKVLPGACLGLALLPLVLSSACGRVEYGDDTGGLDNNSGEPLPDNSAPPPNTGTPPPGNDAPPDNGGGGAVDITACITPGGGAWPFAVSADAYLQLFWNDTAGAQGCACHGAGQAPLISVSADAVAGEFSDAIDAVWGTLADAATSDVQPLAGRIWKHHEGFAEPAPPAYNEQTIAAIDSLIQNVAACANPDAGGGDPGAGGDDPGAGGGEPAGACVEEATVDGWPFEESAESYREVFYDRIVTPGGGCACHTALSPTIPAETAIDAGFAQAINEMQLRLQGATTTDNGLEGGIWRHNADSPNFENPPYSLDVIGAIDDLINDIAACQ